MTTYDPNEWIYEHGFDNKARFVLGKRGSNPVICFGINPSTAVPGKIDGTLRSVERLAYANGFDSWIMLNVYPQRATLPVNIHKRSQSQYHNNNLAHIQTILAATQAPIWAAWGTLIDHRPYFRKHLQDIFNLTTHHNKDWITIGELTKHGHPRHPLYLKSTTHAAPFDADNYI